MEQQTYKDFTVYVSDDLSTDETKDHDASSFPNLKIHWIRRAEKFSGIAEHFSALYAEATEEWIALAHDDEIYAPEWLETLVGMMQQPTPDALPIVMAQVGTVVIDARHGEPQYYKRADQIPDGLYTGNDLKRMCLFDGRHFATNGYLVTREAARRVGAFNPNYEQFDFEWLMRLAQLGRTACSTRLLHTYCMHPQNTVGSVRYLRRYFEQKNPSVMELEWLETLPELSMEDGERRRRELTRNIGRSRFRSYLKVVAAGDRNMERATATILQSDTTLTQQQQKLVAAMESLVVFFLASVFLRVLTKMAAMRRHAQLQPLIVSVVEGNLSWILASSGTTIASGQVIGP